MKNNVGLICTTSAIILGDILLTLKFSGNAWNDILGITLAFMAVTLLFLVLKYATCAFGKLTFKYKNLLQVICLFAGLLILITTALFTIYNFSLYVAAVLLPLKNIFLPFLSISAIAFFLAFGGKKVIFKLSVLVFPSVLLIIVFMFAFSVQFMNVKYLLPYKNVNTNLIYSFFSTFLSLLSSVLPVMCLTKKTKSKVLLPSVLLTFGAFLLCLVNVLGIFGSELAATLSYPYSVSVSTASMGEIFSRLDGFFYSVAFFTALVKTGACIYAGKEIIDLVLYKNKVKKF